MNILDKEKYPKIFLILFCISSFLGAYAIVSSNLYFSFIMLTFKYIFLFLFYKNSVKNTNINISIFIFLSYICGLLFADGQESIIGALSIITYRILLIFYLKKNIKSGFRKPIILIFLLSIVFMALMGLVYYNISFQNISKAYLILNFFSELSLMVLLYYSFIKLEKNIKKGDFMFFLSVSLYIISDSLFLPIHFEGQPEFLKVIISSFYVTANFLIVLSNIRRQKDLGN